MGGDVVTARYGPDNWNRRSRPLVPDYRTHPGRTIDRQPRGLILPVLGEFCDPADCEHPVSARVWPDIAGFVAKCRNCGLHVDLRDEWRIA
jgi:hypothetical protein